MKWNDSETKYLIDNYKEKSDREIASYLNRTVYSISSKRRILNLRNDNIDIKRKVCIANKNRDQYGKNNPNWKGGISQNNYHYKQLQIKRYPERINARNKIHKAIKSGKLKRLPCEICGNEKTHAHHKDYKKPLNVIWLCRKHHKEAHDNKY